MALVEDSCEGRKENLAKANVLAQNSKYYFSSNQSRLEFWSCDVQFDSQPCRSLSEHCYLVKMSSEVV